MLFGKRGSINAPLFVFLCRTEIGSRFVMSSRTLPTNELLNNEDTSGPGPLIDQNHITTPRFCSPCLCLHHKTTGHVIRVAYVIGWAVPVKILIGGRSY